MCGCDNGKSMKGTKPAAACRGATPTSPSSINLTTATSGRRPTAALVQGPAWGNRWQTRRLNTGPGRCCEGFGQIVTLTTLHSLTQRSTVLF